MLRGALKQASSEQNSCDVEACRAYQEEGRCTHDMSDGRIDARLQRGLLIDQGRLAGWAIQNAPWTRLAPARIPQE